MKSTKHLWYRALSAILLITLILSMTVSCQTPPTMEDIDLSDKPLSHFSYSEEITDYVLLSVSYTDKSGQAKAGNIVIRLFPDVAPITVENFQGLVKDGFYDGLIFHRVIEGFMIQGGDPKGTGSGGSGYPIKGEFESNGVENNLQHVRGVVSMARRGDSYNSASSQFFIVQQEYAYGNGEYAAFGYVVYGMDTVDGIAGTAVNANDKPLSPATINFAKFVTASDVEVNAITEPVVDNNNPPQTPAVQMSDLDFSAIDITKCTDSEAITDLVRLNISYTDAAGAQKTGDVVIRLYANVAPITVQNFKDLVKSGFYDGLTFHRVISNFMIQGGDPDGDGTGGSPNNIKGEFTINGVVNNLEHKRGVVSMARLSYPYDSASSQFFIMHKDTPSLNGAYAAFGYVAYGMETVDGIAGTAVNGDDKPLSPATINSAKFVTVSA